ncbi:beta-mannosidase [Nocardia sp. NBC_00511]|uniref:beta-mannosidase n=1 Tax=Nocardia sp. NBC_00511 TaxID=2903591 RepID=UPI0030E2F580
MVAALRNRCLAAFFATGLLMLTGCGSGGHPHQVKTTSVPQAVPAGAPAAPALVSAGPNGLLLRGQPWWPAGFNGPQLATDYAVNFGCGAHVDLDAFFRRLPDNTLTRFAMFQALAVNKQTGALDFKAADAVFAAAEKYGRIILPVLTGQIGDCEDETFKESRWYVDGWTQLTPVHGRAVMSFRDWIDTAVNRWRSSPVLAGWELVGEPEASNCGRTCDLRGRSCPPDGEQILRRFMDAAGALVRAADPQRLIFSGLIGGTQCGVSGVSYRDIGASPNLDVLSYHDYSEEEGPLPGDRYSGLAARLAQARELGKPLLVGEIGEYAGSCRSFEQRRDIIGGSMSGQRAAGSAGALIWAYVPDPRSNECTYDVGPDDPLWGLVAERTTLG